MAAMASVLTGTSIMDSISDELFVFVTLMLNPASSFQSDDLDLARKRWSPHGKAWPMKGKFLSRSM